MPAFRGPNETAQPEFPVIEPGAFAGFDRSSISVSTAEKLHGPEESDHPPKGQELRATGPRES
ncbi:hypothetical protein EKH55_3771 [Sinorhizobium alkalisoli]|nr:hypothetical protein EKH55_3771 [Sinorhizobium alkalisoli]